MAGRTPRPRRRAKTIARLTGDGMREYYIEVKDGLYLYKYFWSRSRNARKHLRDNVPYPETGTLCVVYTSDVDGDVVSACAYDEKGVIRYISW